MKGKVNELNPHTLDEIRNNIRSVIETIEVAVLPKVNLTVITHESNCLIHKDLITNILCKSVHLVYQKQNETKPFIISPSKRAGFKLENYEYVYLYSDTQPTTLFGGGDYYRNSCLPLLILRLFYMWRAVTFWQTVQSK